MSKEKYTYVTLLGSNNYLKGTIALAKALRIQNSLYPLTVLITDEVDQSSIDALKNLDIEYIKIDSIKVSDKIKNKNAAMGYSNWSKTFDKLRVFGLTQFKKIVFLDSDVLVKGNIDHLFELKNFSAVIAGKSYPGNSDWDTPNGGVMVLTPKKGEDKKMIDLIDKASDLSALGDQNVIQLKYPDWYKKSGAVLNEKYNVLAPYEPLYLSKNIVNNPVVLHFVGKIKPWNMTNQDKLMYILKLIGRQLKNGRSFRGINRSIHDFNYYVKLCNEEV